MMGYLRTISVEMEEAALIDGCNRLTALWYIVSRSQSQAL